ncbi:hypothetical protein FRC08_010407 [Ceratobasidium sp. 394]|nr:hypothetical protein FRC08_010407 [Ceratobasidium sp. 394]KAG9095138.1 hypothetical protein FS749_011004 [Ceratobasidium sp. UAMH 11750]
MHDPNFPPNLAIQPSTSSSRTSGNSLAFNQESGIKKYGIAGRVWEAAYTLAAYTMLPQDSYRQKDAEESTASEFDPRCSFFHENETQPMTVVEVGSGTGYAGIHIARQLDVFYRKRNDYSANANVILTDLENVVPLLEEGIQEHAGALGTGVRLEARALEWGNSNHAAALAEELIKLGVSVTHVLCSDLVYFPHLYPQLMRTLLALTSPPFCDAPSSPEVIIGYKVRSLTKEMPFWQVFGTWFTFVPVLVKEIGPSDVEGRWSRFGCAADTHVFIAARCPESFQWDIPAEDSQLMNGFGPNSPRLDDTFESLLLLGIGEDE